MNVPGGSPERVRARHAVAAVTRARALQWSCPLYASWTALMRLGAARGPGVAAGAMFGGPAAAYYVVWVTPPGRPQGLHTAQIEQIATTTAARSTLPQFVHPVPPAARASPGVRAWRQTSYLLMSCVR